MFSFFTKKTVEPPPQRPNSLVDTIIESNKESLLYKSFVFSPNTVIAVNGKGLPANVVTFVSGRKSILSQRIITPDEYKKIPTRLETLLAVIKENGVIVDVYSCQVDKDNPLNTPWEEAEVSWKPSKPIERPHYFYSQNQLTVNSVEYSVVRVSLKLKHKDDFILPEKIDTVANIDSLFKEKKIPFIINGSGTGLAAVLSVAFELNTLFRQKALHAQSLDESIKQVRIDRSDVCLTHSPHLETIKAYHEYLLNGKPEKLVQFNSNREYLLVKRPENTLSLSYFLKKVAEQDAVMIDLFDEEGKQNILKNPINSDLLTWDMGEGKEALKYTFVKHYLKYGDVDKTVVRIRMKKMRGDDPIPPEVLHQIVNLLTIYKEVEKHLKVEIIGKIPYIISSSNHDDKWAAVFAIACELFALSQEKKLTGDTFNELFQLCSQSGDLNDLEKAKYKQTLLDYNAYLIKEAKVIINQTDPYALDDEW